MALEPGSDSYPIVEVKIEPQNHEEQIYCEEADWENSYTEGTVITDGHEAPGIYIEDGDYMYHDSQMEYETIIMPTYQIRTHTGKRPYVCESCNTTVMPNNRPWNHIRILGGGQPIVRHVYYMNFTRKSIVTPAKAQGDKSRKVGKGKKSYPCDKCIRVFGHKSHLDNHLRTHSGEKPFGCLHCDKRFGQKSNLTSHMRRHLGITNLNKLKIKEEPREDGLETDSSGDISKTILPTKESLDASAPSEITKQTEVLQDMPSLTEDVSTNDLLDRNILSVKKSSSSVYEKENCSNTTSYEIDSCFVAATEEVQSQPHSEAEISSVTVLEKAASSHSSLHGSSPSSSKEKEVLSKCDSREIRSSHAREVPIQEKMGEEVSTSASPKKVLFHIRSKMDPSKDIPKPSLSQSELHISPSEKKKSPVQTVTKSVVVSVGRGSAEDRLRRIKSTLQDIRSKEERLKNKASGILS